MGHCDTFPLLTFKPILVVNLAIEKHVPGTVEPWFIT